MNRYILHPTSFLLPLAVTLAMPLVGMGTTPSEAQPARLTVTATPHSVSTVSNQARDSGAQTCVSEVVATFSLWPGRTPTNLPGVPAVQIAKDDGASIIHAWKNIVVIYFRKSGRIVRLDQKKKIVLEDTIYRPSKYDRDDLLFYGRYAVIVPPSQKTPHPMAIFDVEKGLSKKRKSPQSLKYLSSSGLRLRPDGLHERKGTVVFKATDLGMDSQNDHDIFWEEWDFEAQNTSDATEVKFGDETLRWSLEPKPMVEGIFIFSTPGQKAAFVLYPDGEYDVSRSMGIGPLHKWWVAGRGLGVRLKTTCTIGDWRLYPKICVSQSNEIFVLGIGKDGIRKLVKVSCAD